MDDCPLQSIKEFLRYDGLEYCADCGRYSAKKEIIPLTVCVAAMCDVNGIIGASDRMLTAADIQFEPQQPKIIPLTNSLVIMIAGDSSMQAEIIQKLRHEIRKRLDADPEKWMDVSELAELYRINYNEIRFNKAQQSILAPIGLNGDLFISRQKEMDGTFIRQIATELLNYQAPSISAILAGVDNSGAHIYVADNDSIN